MRGSLRAGKLIRWKPLLLAVISCVAVAKTNASDWRVGVIDPGVAGRFSSLAIDSAGNVHVAYLDENEAVLKYAFWDQSNQKWFTTALDKSGGFCSLVLDSKQRPHISYLEYGTGKLKYTHWNGSNWEKEVVDVGAHEVSFYTSITVDQNDLPSITFYEYFGQTAENVLRLRSVTLNGKYWALRTIDSTPGSGKFNSLATDSQGNPAVAYGNVKYENASLRYAHWNGRSWERQIIEGEGMPGTSMWSVRLLMDGDQPHIAYTDVVKRLVKYAVRVDGKWQTEVVDSLVREGYPDRNGIALDDQGNPYVSYFDAGTGILKVAHREDHRWIAEIVDQNFAGFTNSMQFRNGAIWLTYEDEAGRNLKFAYRPISQLASRAQQRSWKDGSVKQSATTAK